MVERLRVLIVEDDHLQAELTVAALRHTTERPEVQVAVDGQHALNALRAGVVWRTGADVVLLDLRLPGLSGHEVLHEIRSDPRLHRLPVIILSSSDRPQDVDAAYDAGANAYVTKPSEFSSLAAIAEAICVVWGGPARPSSRETAPTRDDED